MLDKTNQSSAKEFKVYPWRRLVARLVDGLIFAFIIGIFAFLFLDLQEASEAKLNLLVFILIIPIESLFMYTTGTTPMKAFLKIKVLDINNKTLSLKGSFKRSFLVWCKGLGCGIPFVYPITGILSYRKLKKTGITSWDKSINSTVSCGTLSFGRKCMNVCILLISICILLISISLSVFSVL